ncbi:unnamed protein product [Choristocarpus tenellus]
MQSVGGPFGLIIAHPDDESMFFTPTILRLVKAGEKVFLLCLSSGDFNGLGHLRKHELVKACALLGIPEAREDISLVEHKLLSDGSKEPWPPEVVVPHVASFVTKHSVKTLLTFDNGGVSGHQDHIAVYSGVVQFLKEGAVAFAGEGSGVGSEKGTTGISVLVLVTTNLLRKYCGLLDLPWSWMSTQASHQGEFFGNFDVGTVWGAMAAHRSQFVWYRRLFIVFSRYAYVNTFVRLG